MKISIIGSTGGTGRALVEQLLAAGHEVTAFSRRASAMGLASDELRTIDGDAMSADDVERAVAGQKERGRVCATTTSAAAQVELPW